MVSDGDDHEVRSTGSHSQESTITGKGKGKGKRSSPPTTQTATTTAKTSAVASALPAAISTSTHDLASPIAAATLAAPSAATVLVSTSTSNLSGTARAAAAAASAATSSQSAITCNVEATPVTTVFRPVLLSPYHVVATRDSTCTVSPPCPGSFTNNFSIVSQPCPGSFINTLSTVSHPCPDSFTNTFSVVVVSHIQDTCDTTQLPDPDPRVCRQQPRRGHVTLIPLHLQGTRHTTSPSGIPTHRYHNQQGH
ncbi:uncharacterized protein [Palaemon carinicauda]|uniref:uncharacterized protein n=1 Tax=Palaemon carinicauda TaxID=392227 RepID=UPI0035B5B4C8